MGNKTDPSMDVYGLYDNPLFPPGQTPKILKVSFMGIQAGLAWTPDMPLPPNRIFHLTQIGIYDWGYVGLVFSCSFSVAFQGYCACEIGVIDGWPVFDNIFNATGTWSCNNYLRNYQDAYYNGAAAASFIADVGSVSAVKTMLELGLERDGKTLYEHYPTSEGQIIQRFARTKDSTCIYVKKDYE